MLNRVVIMGRIVRDIELRYTNTQVPVASFTVAVDRDKSSGQEKQTDFIDCCAWRQAAEFIHKYYRKGSMIVVEGRLQSRKWEDRDGNKRINWEVAVEKTYFGESKRSDTSSGAYAPPSPQGEGNRSGYKPAGRPRDVEPPVDDGFYDMPGSGQGNPFQDPYAQSDMFGNGDLPF